MSAILFYFFMESVLSAGAGNTSRKVTLPYKLADFSVHHKVAKVLEDLEGILQLDHQLPVGFGHFIPKVFFDSIN